MPDKLPSPFIFSPYRAAAPSRLARLCATWLLGLTLGASGTIVMTSIVRADDTTRQVLRPSTASPAALSIPRVSPSPKVRGR